MNLTRPHMTIFFITYKSQNTVKEKCVNSAKVKTCQLKKTEVVYIIYTFFYGHFIS